jgi:hypothetical protein
MSAITGLLPSRSGRDDWQSGRTALAAQFCGFHRTSRTSTPGSSPVRYAASLVRIVLYPCGVTRQDQTGVGSGGNALCSRGKQDSTILGPIILGQLARPLAGLRSKSIDEEIRLLVSRYAFESVIGVPKL